MNEIGSEFWGDSHEYLMSDIAQWNSWPGYKQFYISGRTALNAILEDILAERECHMAYLPSYCCHTMIEPFIRHGIAVDFYSVDHDGESLKQNINPLKKCDVVLVMDYFGFSGYTQSLPNEAIIIRDMTHSIFSCKRELSEDDYLFASFRKWDAIAGAAIACKRGGKWSINPPVNQNDKYLQMRNKGYDLKSQYMSGIAIDKQVFLEIFRQAEDLLDEDYIGYCVDEESFKRASNLEYCIQARRKNAKELLIGLADVTIAEPMFSTIAEDEVPLFVPILVKDGRRDSLKRFLINHDIYCPVHWPLSELHSISDQEKHIYEREISLICDQRYGKEDMLHQIDVIRRFENNNA